MCLFFPWPMERRFSLLFLQQLANGKSIPSEIYLLHLVLKALLLEKKCLIYHANPCSEYFLLFIEACLSPRIKFIELQTKRQSMTKELQTDKRSLPIRTLSGNDPVSVPPARRVCSVYMKQFWNYHNVSMKLAPSFSSLHAKELVGKK